MNYIEKIKRKRILEICFLIVVIVVSYFLWDFKPVLTTAAYYNDASLIEVLEDGSYRPVLYRLDDMVALADVDDYRLTLYNSTYRRESYQLFLGLPNTLEQEHTKIKLDEIVYLKDLQHFHDEEYTYYLIDESMLQAGEKSITFQLWNDMNGENFKVFDPKFKVQKI